MLPLAVSGVFRSESTPVSSTPGASVPLIARSRLCRRNASWAEPNSTAIVLLPEMLSEAPAGASVGSRCTAGRWWTGEAAAGSLSGAASVSGR